MAEIKKISTEFQPLDKFLDTSGDAGTANQVLVSTATGVDWVDGSGSGIIGGPYLPLSAGASYPLTASLWLYDNSGASPSLYLKNGSDNYWRLLNGSTGIFSLKEGTSDRITILPGGNVGIGTTSPSAKLVIRGADSTADFADYGIAVFENQQSEGLSIGYDTNGDYSWLFSREVGVSSRGLRLNGSIYVAGVNGNVGIGTTSPTTKLDVAGDSSTMMTVRNTGTVSSVIISNGSSSNQIFSRGVNSSTGRDLSFVQGTSEAMRIDTSGNVGIGTTTPAHKLTINAPNNTTAVGIDFPSAHFDFSANSTSAYTSNFRLDNVGMDIGHDSTARSLNLQTGNLDRVTILGNGNVGIETTSPAYKLDVNGEARSTHFRDGAKGVGTTSTAAGWYKIASWTGGARGGSEIKLSTTGGSFAPVTWVIRCYKDWSGGATLKLEQYGPTTWFTKARVVYDNTSTVYYLEIYQPGTTAVSFDMYQTSLMGYDASITMTTGTLVAGTTGGTTRTELPFTVNGTSVEALTIGDSGNTGPYLPLAGGTMTGNIAMGNNNITGLSQLAFTDNIRFDDLGADNYLRLTYGNTGHGGLQIYDGDNTLQGYLYADGGGTSSFGLLSGTGEWGVKVVEGANTSLYYNASQKLLTTNTGIDVTGTAQMDTGITEGIHYVGTGVEHWGDGGTGMSFPANDTLSLKTASSDRLYINSTGNVGIGTTSPIKKLHVKETSGTYEAAIFETNSGGSFIRNVDSTGTVETGIEGGKWSARTSNTQRLVIDSSGNVGIGTTSPLSRLHVSDSSGGVIYLQDSDSTSTYNITSLSNNGGNLSFDTRNSSGVYVSTDYQIVKGAGGANYQRWFTSATERMRITSTGNVGIGTTSPSEKLEVSEGYILSSGASTSHGFELQRTGSDTYQLRHLDGGLTVFNSTDSRKEMTFDGAGNVGIGTTSPVYKLDVNGDVNVPFGASTGYRINGNRTLSQVSGAFELGVLDYKTTYPNISFNNDNTFRVQQNGSTRIIVNSSGNVGIGTTSPTNYKLQVNGTVESSAFSVEGASARIFAPSGANYNGSGTQTGYLIAKLPDNAGSGINNMMTGVIRVYDYASNESFDVHFAGYWYSGYNWTNCSAWIDSAAYADRNFSVRFGKMDGVGTGTRPYIMIGEATSTWTYCKFSVINYEPGHSNYEAYKWDKGWNMDINATNPGTVLVTASNTQTNNWARNGQDLYYGSGSGNVGIGTTSPSAKLDLGETANQSIRLKTALSNSAFYSSWQDAAIVGVNRNPSNGAFTDTLKSASAILLYGQTSDGYITFNTSNTNNSTPTERMRITSAGGISFGSTGTAYGTAGQVLTSAGNASPTWTTPTTGDITAIVAGDGMTGTSLSGPIPTLNVIGGDGITANADDIQVDSTVVRTSGTQAIAGLKTFSNDVTIANTADLKFVDTAGTFPTSGKGFDWTLNNDGARIYAIQPSSDAIDFVFQLRDNATSGDRFVFHVQEWQGTAYDKYPLIIRAGTEFDLVDSALYTNGTIRLSNAGALSNVTNTNWDNAYNNRITSLTTTGTSGPATLISNVLNIPNYADGQGVTSVGGTAPIVSSGGTTPDISITAATTGAAGSMSAADKTKLDGIATGANTGTVTSVTAGSGMTQTGTSTVNPTLNVIGGTGITANADDVAITYVGSGNAILAATDSSGTTLATGAKIWFSDDGTIAQANVSDLPFTNTAGTVTSVGGTGTVSGLTLTGTVTSSGNLTLGGTLALTSGNITTGLGFTPYNATNPAGYTSNTGDITAVNPGTNLNGGGLSGSVTVNLDNDIAINTVEYTYPTSNSQFYGEIVTFGAFGLGFAAGELVCLGHVAGSPTWRKANNTVAVESTGMLGIALGSTPSAGILVRGFARSAAYNGFSDGGKCYISATDGDMTTTAPTATNAYLRIVGYVTDSITGAAEIYFCPDNTYVQIT